MARQYILCDNAGILDDTWYSDDLPDPVGVYWAHRDRYPSCNQAIVGPVMYSKEPYTLQVVAGGKLYTIAKNYDNKWEVLREDGSCCTEVATRAAAITYALRAGNRVLKGVPRGPHKLPDYGSAPPAQEAPEADFSRQEST